MSGFSFLCHLPVASLISPCMFQFPNNYNMRANQGELQSLYKAPQSCVLLIVSPLKQQHCKHGPTLVEIFNVTLVTVSGPLYCLCLLKIEMYKAFNFYLINIYTI